MQYNRHSLVYWQNEDLVQMSQPCQLLTCYIVIGLTLRWWYNNGGSGPAWVSSISVYTLGDAHPKGSSHFSFLDTEDSRLVWVSSISIHPVGAPYPSPCTSPSWSLPVSVRVSSILAVGTAHPLRKSLNFILSQHTNKAGAPSRWPTLRYSGFLGDPNYGINPA